VTLTIEVMRTLLSCKSGWKELTAIKLSETKWQVILNDGSILVTEQNYLLDKNKCSVKKALNQVSIAEEHKMA
jgi:hypothetical protein